MSIRVDRSHQMDAPRLIFGRRHVDLHRDAARGQRDGVVVLGVVVVTVVGDDDGGGGAASGAPARGAGAGAGAASGADTGSGAGGGGSLCIAAALAAVVGGVVMAGAEGGAVLGTVFAFDCAGPVSFITAVTDPKPTRSAATHASGSKTARPPILEEKERPPSSSAAGSIHSRGPSSCRCGAPSASCRALGSVGARSASCSAIESVASSRSATPLPLTFEMATIELSATDPVAERHGSDIGALICIRARPSLGAASTRLSVPVNPPANENFERPRQVSLVHSVDSAHLNRALGACAH